MSGFIVGAVSGTAQFFLLARFTRAITGGVINSKIVLLGLLQFFIPVLVLTVCAFLLRDDLMWAGIGMAIALISCALVRFIAYKRKTANTDKEGD